MAPKIFSFTELFDSHAHLSMIDGDTNEIIQRSVQAGVVKIVDVANDLDTTKTVLKLQKDHPEIILATAGIHPEIAIPASDLYQDNLDEVSVDNQLKSLDEIIEQNPNCFSMIGETGLDYYWLEKSDLAVEEIQKSKSLQKQLFIGQLNLSKKYNLPITLHARSAHKECVQEVKNISGLRGVFHSFTGNVFEAKEIFDLGFAIGINGIITYRSAQDLRDTILTLTKDKEINTPADLYACGIYLETDSPFLIPSNIKDRPKFNSPEQISALWNFVYNLLSNR